MGNTLETDKKLTEGSSDGYPKPFEMPISSPLMTEPNLQTQLATNNTVDFEANDYDIYAQTPNNCVTNLPPEPESPVIEEWSVGVCRICQKFGCLEHVE